jgi:hypothetical protein
MLVLVENGEVAAARPLTRTRKRVALAILWNRLPFFLGFKHTADRYKPRTSRVRAKWELAGGLPRSDRKAFGQRRAAWSVAAALAVIDGVVFCESMLVIDF